MSQFIRKNIDIISSKTTSRPQTQDTSESLETLEEALTAVEHHGTILNTGLSSHLFDNYTYYPNSGLSYSTKREKLYVAGAVNGPFNASKDKEPEGDLTSQSYQSARETLPRKIKQSESTLPIRSEYELQTEPLEQVHTYSSLATETNHSTLRETEDGGSSSSQLLRSKLWNWYRYVCERKWKHRQPIEDPERQPLLPSRPSDSTSSSPQPSGTLTSPDEGGNGDLVDTLWGIDRQTLFKTAAVVVGITITIIILIRGDSQLLFRIVRALVCYLFGTIPVRSLLGSDFCPSL